MLSFLSLLSAIRRILFISFVVIFILRMGTGLIVGLGGWVGMRSPVGLHRAVKD